MRKAKADGFWGKEKRTTKTNPLLGKTFIWRSRSLQWARFRSMDARLRDFFCETPPLSAALQFVELRSAGMPYCSSSSFESTCLMWNASFFLLFFIRNDLSQESSRRNRPLNEQWVPETICGVHIHAPDRWSYTRRARSGTTCSSHGPTVLSKSARRSQTMRLTLVRH